MESKKERRNQNRNQARNAQGKKGDTSGSGVEIRRSQSDTEKVKKSYNPQKQARIDEELFDLLTGFQSLDVGGNRLNQSKQRLRCAAMNTKPSAKKVADAGSGTVNLTLSR